MTDTRSTTRSTTRPAVAAARWVIGVLCVAAFSSIVAAPIGQTAEARAPQAPTTTAPYPPREPEIKTDKTKYPPKGTAKVTITGFAGCPGVVIQVFGTTIEFTIVPDADGNLTFDLELPEEPGTYDIIATCPETGKTVTTQILVEGDTPIITDPPQTDPSTTVPVSVSSVPPTNATGGNLPATGGDTGRPVLVGLVLVMAGASFVVVARLRRRPAAR